MYPKLGFVAPVRVPASCPRLHVIWREQVPPFQPLLCPPSPRELPPTLGTHRHLPIGQVWGGGGGGGRTGKALSPGVGGGMRGQGDRVGTWAWTWAPRLPP